MHWPKLTQRVVIDASARRRDLSSIDIGGANRRNKEFVSDIDDRDTYLWDDLPPSTDLRAEQKRLCPPVIVCSDIVTERKYIAKVDSLEMVTWDEKAIDYLVLEENKKQILRGLVSHHSHRAEDGRDLVENKGKGLVILLHGPPGVSMVLLLSRRIFSSEGSADLPQGRQDPYS